MVKVILHGCNGKMGQMVTELCSQDEDIKIVAGIDAFHHQGAGEYPVYRDVYNCNITADALIDFSTASAVDSLMDYCVEKKIPCVVCTTGLSEEQLERVRSAAEKIPVLRSANMTLGINLLIKLLREAAALLTLYHLAQIPVRGASGVPQTVTYICRKAIFRHALADCMGSHP